MQFSSGVACIEHNHISVGARVASTGMLSVHD